MSLQRWHSPLTINIVVVSELECAGQRIVSLRLLLDCKIWAYGRKNLCSVLERRLNLLPVFGGLGKHRGLVNGQALAVANNHFPVDQDVTYIRTLQRIDQWRVDVVERLRVRLVEADSNDVCA